MSCQGQLVSSSLSPETDNLILGKKVGSQIDGYQGNSLSSSPPPEITKKIGMDTISMNQTELTNNDKNYDGNITWSQTSANDGHRASYALTQADMKSENKSKSNHSNSTKMSKAKKRRLRKIRNIEKKKWKEK